MKFLTNAQTFFVKYKGDLLGGLTASVVSLPAALGFGILIFSPFGNQYTAEGAFAGVCGAIFSAFFSSLFGGTKTQITAPSAPSTMILMSFTATVLTLSTQTSIIFVLGCLYLTIVVAGVIQILFGLCRIGQFIKFVPYAVVSGFLNGIGVILIIKQFQALFGFRTSVSYGYMLTHLSEIQPLTVIIGMIALLIAFNSKYISKAIPAPLLTVVIGSLIFYLFKYLFPTFSFGLVIGHINATLPNLKGLSDIFVLTTTKPSISAQLISLILLTSLILALLGSLQSLLTAIAVDIATGTRHKSNQELVGQGIGNTISGLFGGLHCASLPPLTIANINAGAKTKLSGMFCGIAIFIYLLVAWPLIALIPHVIIAAVIMFLGYSIIDKQSWINLIRNKFIATKEFYLDLFITIIVTLATIFLNLIIAIFLGICLAILIYVFRVSKLNIRKFVTLDLMHSRVRRPEYEELILQQEGKNAVWIQLQGALFFISAAFLYDRIEATLKEVTYVILDMKFLTYCDLTSIKILQRLFLYAKQQRKYLVFSNFDLNSMIFKLLAKEDFYKHLHVFTNAELAIEWVEEKILEINKMNIHPISPIQASGLFQNLSQEEQAFINGAFKFKNIEPGENVFEKNNHDLYILLEGQLSIYSKLDQFDEENSRLIGVRPGSIIGEIAFLTKSTRTAIAKADKKSVVAIFPHKIFLQIIEENPSCAIQLITNLCLNLALYLRHAQKEIVLLEKY